MSDYVTSEQFERFLREEEEHHQRQEQQILDVHAEVQSLRNEVQPRLDRHHKTLYGNGEPGMDEMLRNINNWINDQKKLKDDKTAEWKKYLFWGITFLLSNAFGFLLAQMMGKG